MRLQTAQHELATDLLSSHGLSFYRDVAHELHDDPLWRRMAMGFTYSIVQDCVGTCSAAIFLRFVAGELKEVELLRSWTECSSDLLLSGSLQTWGAILLDEVSFVSAFMLKALTVQGLQPEIGKDIASFAYLLKVIQSVAARRVERSISAFVGGS